MRRNALWISVGLLLANASLVLAQGVAMPVCPPVDHPVVVTNPVRTSAVWRKNVEGFGEDLIRNTMELRGYKMQNIKLPGNHGIDLFALKRNPAGQIVDLKIIEAKAHYGKGMPHLGQTISGKQMSRKWLADRLRALRNAGGEGKTLARDISHFQKEQGLSILQLAEVHDINLRTGRYTIRDPITLRARSGPMSIEKLLKNVASRTRNLQIRAWSVRHLDRFDRILQARMQNWLGGSARSRVFGRLFGSRLVAVASKLSLRGAGRCLARCAGPIGLAVAIAMDANEMYGHVRDYQRGSISRRECYIALASSGGGIAGAWAGAAGGAWAGGGIGAVVGVVLFDEITIPVGAFVGGVAGGIGGYFCGSCAGDAAARAFYGKLDEKVRNQVNQWVVNTGNPF